MLLLYRIISRIFRVGLIFAEFATSLNSRKIDSAKNKPYYTFSLRVLEIAKIRLSEKLTHLPSLIFAKISRREKFPIYGINNFLVHYRAKDDFNIKYDNNRKIIINEIIKRQL